MLRGARQDREIFERNLPFPELVQVMFLARNESRKAGRVLIFLDEIQASPGAVGSLRFFSEQAPDLHVAAAGSLLELMLARVGAGFPVGRVEYLFMYPLSFEEFLAALGMESALELYRTIPCPEHARQPLLSLFHRYAQVGGMPEAVRLYSGPLRRDAARTQRGKDYQLLSLPYFLAGQIDRYLRWMVG